MPARSWTREKVNEAKRYYDQGLTYSEIAAAVGAKNKNAIAGLACRENWPKRGTFKLPSVWNDKKDADLVRLQGEGLPWSEIGQRLGHSLAAVRERFRKLQLRKHKKAVQRTLKHVGNLRPKPKRVAPTPPERHDKRLGELWRDLDGKCQFPKGDPRNGHYRICGKKCKGAVYCEEHMAAAYIVKPREAPTTPAPRPELRTDYA